MPDRSFLAWPFFEERHRALATKLEAFAENNLAPLETDIDMATRRLVWMLGGEGWLRHCVPPPYGDGIDVRTLCLIRETLARYDGLADFAFAMQGLGSVSIALFGTDALKERYLPR